MPFIRKTRLAAGAVLLSLVVAPTPAFAQDRDTELRIRKLEAEVRALQRRVFPGGDGRFFEPEITAEPQERPAPSNSTTALTDVLARLDALESQIAQLTGQGEENAFAIRGLATRIDTLEARDAAAREAEAEAEAETAASAPRAAAPSPERVAAVRAIAKPQTDNPGDDEYSYGFRLWDAGFFPEAQQQLTLFVERYPDHSRATFGRNLLGRAYLDDGKPREAAPWFLQNYQADKNAARAADSLLHLAEAMIALEDTERACIALAEFGATYPAVATGRLQSRFAQARRSVTCD